MAISWLRDDRTYTVRDSGNVLATERNGSKQKHTNINLLECNAAIQRLFMAIPFNFIAPSVGSQVVLSQMLTSCAVWTKLPHNTLAVVK